MPFLWKSLVGQYGSDVDWESAHTVNSLIQAQLNQNLISLTFEERVGSFYFFFKPVFKKKVIERVVKTREGTFNLFGMLLSTQGYYQHGNRCCFVQNSLICSLTSFHKTIKLPLKNPMNSYLKCDHETKNTWNRLSLYNDFVTGCDEMEKFRLWLWNSWVQILAYSLRNIR